MLSQDNQRHSNFVRLQIVNEINQTINISILELGSRFSTPVNEPHSAGISSIFFLRNGLIGNIGLNFEQGYCEYVRFKQLYFELVTSKFEFVKCKHHLFYIVI